MQFEYYLRYNESETGLIMTKWYEQKYVNHRDWILDHLEMLGLSAQETVLVLLIDFFNQNSMEITMELLSQKTGMSSDETDKVVSTLCAKQYLEIRASSRKVTFSLNGLFETDTAKYQRVLDSPLFETFESEFGRPLSQTEMQKISDWNRTIDRKLIIYALRQASIYQKLSLPYIEGILNAWIKKGYTAEMIEAGKS